MNLHVVTDGKKTNEKLASILTSIHPYVDRIHIREKEKTAKQIVDLIELLLVANVPSNKILVNDRVDVAQALSLRGVQLAFHSLDVLLTRKAFPRLEIGCSVHSQEDAKYAMENGADFLLYGHIFTTNSKQGLNPRGVQALQTVVNNSTVPVVAIGGITPTNVHQVIETGAAGIAVMSGILDAIDPVEMALDYVASLSNNEKGGG